MGSRPGGRRGGPDASPLAPPVEDRCNAKVEVASKFLETIFFDKRYNELIRPRGVLIKGALFKDDLELSNMRIEHDLALKCSRFEKGVNLAGLRTEGELSFSRSEASGDLDLSAIQTRGNASFDRTYLTTIDLHNAKIGHQLTLDHANVAGAAETKAIQVGSKATFIGGNYRGDVDLDNAKIGDTVDFTASTVYGQLDLSRAQVGNAVYLAPHEPADDVSFFCKLVDFEHTRIGLKLWLARRRFFSTRSIWWGPKLMAT